MPALNFNAENVAPDTGRGPVPRGYYKVMIIASELILTKRGDGEMIKLTLQIYEGALKGKSVTTNLTWRNASAVAQDIGHSQLSAICHAVGQHHIQDTTQLHNLPLGIRAEISGDGRFNEIDEFFNANDVDSRPELPPVMQAAPVPSAPPSIVPMAPAASVQPAAPATPAQPAQPMAPAIPAQPVQPMPAQQIMAPPAQAQPVQQPAQPAQPPAFQTVAPTQPSTTPMMTTTSPSEAAPAQPQPITEAPPATPPGTPDWIANQQTNAPA